MTDLPAMPGALVISLDFELHWGVRDHHDVSSPYVRNLLGARSVIPRILQLFERFEIQATWATVGMLGCDGREQLMRVRPHRVPAYLDGRLSPYSEIVGNDEHEDPLHFAPSVIGQIANTIGQEVGSHTFSHFYCLEPGQTEPDFVADLEAVKRIHRSLGLPAPRSIVFPRNQVNERYFATIIQHGFRVFRGNQPSWMYRPAGHASRKTQAWSRGARLLDAYLPLNGHHLTDWRDVLLPNGLCKVPASLFVRPCTRAHESRMRLREERISRAMTAAARQGKIVHLWWHPHNFGAAPEANLSALERLLRSFSALRDRYEMRSSSMSGIVEAIAAK